MNFSSLQIELENLKEKNLFRSLRQIDSSQENIVLLQGRECVNFSSNNYLGLANDTSLKSASIKATEAYGTGSGASRLVTGSMKSHHELEKKIAEFKQTEAALVFNSGYHANIGALSALLREGDLVFSDELNHASIIDGCKLSKATVKVYRHSDLLHLKRLLEEASQIDLANNSRRLIVTDSVFSMDGDLAPLKELMELAKNYDCGLMVDEAHATGVFGENGRGLVEEKLQSEDRKRLIQMGTLGKALGSFGAYIAGSRVLIDYLINKSRPFIYTTALPPGVMAASLAAIEVVQSKPEIRKKLWDNIEYFCNKSSKIGQSAKKKFFLNFPLRAVSPIVPLIIGDSKKALEISEKLFDKGLLVTAIRYPTVAHGTERLRITFMATHTKEQIDQLLEALNELV